MSVIDRDENLWILLELVPGDRRISSALARAYREQTYNRPQAGLVTRSTPCGSFEIVVGSISCGIWAV